MLSQWRGVQPLSGASISISRLSSMFACDMLIKFNAEKTNLSLLQQSHTSWCNKVTSVDFTIAALAFSVLQCGICCYSSGYSGAFLRGMIIFDADSRGIKFDLPIVVPIHLAFHWSRVRRRMPPCSCKLPRSTRQQRGHKFSVHGKEVRS